jgi:hypothetical protein
LQKIKHAKSARNAEATYIVVTARNVASTPPLSLSVRQLLLADEQVEVPAQGKKISVRRLEHGMAK